MKWPPDDEFPIGAMVNLVFFVLLFGSMLCMLNG